MARGTITRLIRSHGYVFILGDNGYELFFLRKELSGVHYESLKEGQRVEFEVSWMASGGREVKARPIGKKGTSAPF